MAITPTFDSFGLPLASDMDKSQFRAWANAIEAAVNSGAASAAIAAIGALTPAANKLPYFTGPSAAALADFSAFARTLLDDTSALSMLQSMGVRLPFGAIADDGVAVLNPYSAQIFGGFLLICSTSSSITKPAILWIRGANSTAETRLIAEATSAGGNSFLLTTGVLTGTTSTDGRATVSLDVNGNIYVENRVGGGIAVTAFFFQIA